MPRLFTSVQKLLTAVQAQSTSIPKPFPAVPAPPTSVQKLVFAVPEPLILIPYLFPAVPETRQQLKEPKFNSNSDCVIGEHCNHTCDEIDPDDYSENGN